MQNTRKARVLSSRILKWIYNILCCIYFWMSFRNIDRKVTYIFFNVFNYNMHFDTVFYVNAFWYFNFETSDFKVLIWTIYQVPSMTSMSREFLFFFFKIDLTFKASTSTELVFVQVTVFGKISRKASTSRKENLAKEINSNIWLI